MRNVKKIVAVFFLAFFSFGIIVAHGQQNSSQNASTQLPVGEGATEENHYKIDCQKYQLDCHIAYGKAGDQVEQPASPQTRQREFSNIGSSQPLVFGPISIIIVIVLVVGVILLWLRFGGAGVLLSPAPKEIDPVHEVPENWNQSSDMITHKKSDVLSKIIAIEDRRIALIELLRMCLLHGATISSTRIARSDTERTVIRRLPKELPQRSELEVLLTTTELVHYGGEDISEDQFDLLIDKARSFLSVRKMAHA